MKFRLFMPPIGLRTRSLVADTTTAFVVIDTKRDIIDPCGFGESLGADVSRPTIAQSPSAGREIVPTPDANSAVFV